MEDDEYEAYVAGSPAGPSFAAITAVAVIAALVIIGLALVYGGK
jgi:hypothetical protein